MVFVTGDDGSLEGTALLVDLLRANPAASVAVATQAGPCHPAP